MEKWTQELEQIEKILVKMEKLAGETSFDKSDFWGESWDEFYDLESQLIMNIVQIIKSEDRDFEYSLLMEKWGSEDFWEVIQKKVEKETKGYVKLRILRKLPLDERIQSYRTIFPILYEERETRDYICDKMSLDTEIASGYLQVLRFCENAIVNHFFSKRLFEMKLRADFGLQEEESESLWELYNENWRIVEGIAYNNRLSTIEYRISKIMEQVESISDKVEILDFVFDYLDVNSGMDD